MSYHSKNHIDISIFFRDMAFPMRQGENMRNPTFLVVSGPPGTARFTKMAKNVISLLIFTYFFISETFKVIREILKFCPWWGTSLRESGLLSERSSRLSQNRFSIFSQTLESFISEKMSRNEQENAIFCHFSKSGRSWGPRNCLKS